MKLTILGSSSAKPSYGRKPTAQILNMRERLYLIDCGEGTQMQLNKYQFSHNRIDHVFISHLHGDHFFGLIGLLNTMSLMGRTRELHIYAPPQLKNIISAHHLGEEQPFSFFMIFTDLIAGETIQLIDNLKVYVKAFPVCHSIPCHGFYFEEKYDKLVLLPEKCTAYNIPSYFRSQLKRGIDYTTKEGETISHEWVTKPSDKKSQTYAYTADTGYFEEMIPHFKEVNTLYHETTYLHNKLENATKRKHSTTHQAARIAELAKVGRLIIGHYSSAYKILDDFEIETKEIFQNTFLAKEGLTFEW